MRRAGYSTHRVPDARMEHRLGAAVNLPRPLRRFYAQHAPVRRYYMSRNYLYLAERFVARFPLFIVKLGVAQLIQGVLIAFFDPKPLANYRAMIAGAGDYLRRRRGRCERVFG